MANPARWHSPREQGKAPTPEQTQGSDWGGERRRHPRACGRALRRTCPVLGVCSAAAVPGPQPRRARVLQGWCWTGAMARVWPKSRLLGFVSRNCCSVSEEDVRWVSEPRAQALQCSCAISAFASRRSTEPAPRHGGLLAALHANTLSPAGVLRAEPGLRGLGWGVGQAPSRGQ